MRGGTFVFTNVFEHFGIRRVVDRDGERQGLDQSFGVVVSNLKLDVTKVHPPEPLGHTEILRMRMSEPVEPTSVIETRAFDHQRIADPVADRVAHPGRIRIFCSLRPSMKICRYITPRSYSSTTMFED